MISIYWSTSAHQYSRLDLVWMELVVVMVEENVDVVGWGFPDLKIHPHHQHLYHCLPEIVSGLLVTLEIYCGYWVGHPEVEWGSDSFKSDYSITVMGGSLPLIMVR
jgi:hypothetical protein